MNINKQICNENNPLRNTKDIQSLTIHHTWSQASDVNMWKYLNKVDYISAHYLVRRDGKVFQLMDDDRIAYHAWVSSYKGLKTKWRSLNWNTIW